MQLQATKNYKMFKLVNSNREVDEAHVKRIMESIKEKNLLSVHPINVNTALEVIDGQHRLSAAEKLGVDIYYIVNDDISSKDMSRLNSIKKNWTLEDYLNHYIVEGLLEYKKVGQFVKKFTRIPLSGVIEILGARYPGLLTDFKNGKFVVSSYEEGLIIAGEIDRIKDIPTMIGKHLFSTAFLRVFLAARDHEKFDFPKFVKQIEKQPRSFVPCANAKQYLDMITEIYNYDIRGENRVSFSLKK
ncbi:MAG: ParB N-terminal domain-containing protein [Agriterribacter sp.]